MAAAMQKLMAIWNNPVPKNTLDTTLYEYILATCSLYQGYVFAIIETYNYHFRH